MRGGKKKDGRMGPPPLYPVWGMVANMWFAVRLYPEFFPDRLLKISLSGEKKQTGHRQGEKIRIARKHVQFFSPDTQPDWDFHHPARNFPMTQAPWGGLPLG